MRWNVSDIEKYESAKVYIDTALFPIFSIDPDQVGVSMLFEQKWLEEVCIYAERQLTGRLVLFPTMYVLNGQFALANFAPALFTNRLFVTAEPLLYEKLRELKLNTYQLPRKENENDLTEMVREGKKLTKYLMEEWNKY